MSKGPCDNPDLRYFAKASGTPLSVFEDLPEDSQYPDWEMAAHKAGYRAFSCCVVRYLTKGEPDGDEGRRAPTCPESTPAAAALADTPESLLAEVGEERNRLRERMQREGIAFRHVRDAKDFAAFREQRI